MFHFGGRGPLVFLHIPKSGGTSVHKALTRFFKPERICPERSSLLTTYDAKHLRRYRFFSGHFDRQAVEHIPGRKKVVSLFREPKERILSLYYFWRSHRDYLIDRHNLVGPRMARRLDLLSFLRSRDPVIVTHIDNHQVRMLLGELYAGPCGEFLVPEDEVLDRAVEFLDAMLAVGTLDRIDHFVEELRVALRLDIAGPVPHEFDHRDLGDRDGFEPVVKEVVTGEIQAELERLTRLDQQLYARVVDRLSRKVDQTKYLFTYLLTSRMPILRQGFRTGSEQAA